MTVTQSVVLCHGSPSKPTQYPLSQTCEYIFTFFRLKSQKWDYSKGMQALKTFKFKIMVDWQEVVQVVQSAMLPLPLPPVGTCPLPAVSWPGSWHDCSAVKRAAGLTQCCGGSCASSHRLVPQYSTLSVLLPMLFSILFPLCLFLEQEN